MISRHVASCNGLIVPIVVRNCLILYTIGSITNSVNSTVGTVHYCLNMRHLGKMQYKYPNYETSFHTGMITVH